MATLLFRTFPRFFQNQLVKYLATLFFRTFDTPIVISPIFFPNQNTCEKMTMFLLHKFCHHVILRIFSKIYYTKDPEQLAAIEKISLKNVWVLSFLRVKQAQFAPRCSSKSLERIGNCAYFKIHEGPDCGVLFLKNKV